MAPIPLLHKGGGNFQFNYDGISRLLSNPKLQDLPVAIVAIAGGFRKGKSFLISQAVAYVTGRQVNESEEIFKFVKSSARQTEGIDAWGEPIVVTKRNGEKIVVLFLDTQGTFDTETSFNENAIIFGLAATVSSVFMYNIMRQLDSSDLNHLAYFVNFGQIAQKSGHKVYQDLIYVVRDWCNPHEHPYGFQGGNEMLKQHYKEAIADIQNLHNKVTDSFASYGAFLCPFPGERVRSHDFKGDLQELDPLFQQHFPDLLKNLLSPDYLRPKTFNGQQLKCKDAAKVMKILFDCLVNGPKAEDLLEITARRTHEEAKQTAQREFTMEINKIESNLESYSEDQLSESMNRIADKTIKRFHESPRMGGSNYEKDFERSLKSFMKKRCEEIKSQHQIHLNRIVVEQQNIVLDQQRVAIQQEQEARRLENEQAQQKVQLLQQEREAREREWEQQLENVRKAAAEQKEEFDRRLCEQQKENEEQKRRLEEQMEEQRRMAQRQTEENELRMRKMQRDQEEQEKKRQEEAQRMKEEYEERKMEMQQMDAAEQRRIQQQVQMFQQKQMMEQQARDRENERRRVQEEQQERQYANQMRRDREREQQEREDRERARRREEMQVVSCTPPVCQPSGSSWSRVMEYIPSIFDLLVGVGGMCGKTKKLAGKARDLASTGALRLFGIGGCQQNE